MIKIIIIVMVHSSRTAVQTYTALYAKFDLCINMTI